MDEKIMNLTLSDQWNFKSVEAITFLQERLAPYEWWVVQSSILGDNSEAFILFFPLVAGFMNTLGIKALWAYILVEWSNTILKWVFQGDRPYWWINQSFLYTDVTRPNLRQFPNTCQSQPGTPSNHLMMIVAMFYVVTRGLSKSYVGGAKKIQWSKILVSFSIHVVYLVWIAIAFVSQLYIQSHFIHQCVLGIFLGLLIGHISWSSKWLVKPHPFGSVVFANLLGGSALLIYKLLLNKGMDSQWAVTLALKHCKSPEYVLFDAHQPYDLMIRFAAASFGLGFAIASKNRKVAHVAPKSLLRTILSIKAGLLLGRLFALAQKALPRGDLILYLSSSFVLHMLFPYVVVALIPYLLFTLYPSK